MNFFLQKEMRNCRLKKQFDMVLAHQEEKCGGLSLQQLLLRPSDRVSKREGEGRREREGNGEEDRKRLER